MATLDIANWAKKNAPKWVLENVDLIAGIIFGAAMQRARVHESSLIIGQMTFSHFVMLKMFLSALGTSMIIASRVFKTLPIDKMEDMWTHSKTPHEVMIGAAILGLGMTVSGSCPGSVFPQLGSLSTTAVFIFIGGIIGTMLYHHFQKLQVPRIGEPIDKAYNSLHKVINDYFHHSFTPSEIGLYGGVALLGAVLFLELIIPWQKDLLHLYPGLDIKQMSYLLAHPPMVSGIMIGSAQWLLSTFVNRRLGCTMSYESYLTKGLNFLLQTAQGQQQNTETTTSPQAKVSTTNDATPNNTDVSTLVCDVIQNRLGLPQEVFCRVDHNQWLGSVGMVLGSFAMSLLTWSWHVGNNAHGFDGVSPLRAIIGGILLVFGARYAGGCTSGHGLSGCGFLSTTSALAVVAMFGSAIVSGILFKIVGI